MSKERYIAAKQKWAEKQKAAGVTARMIASPDRLPPGQKLTTGFPVLDLGESRANAARVLRLARDIRDRITVLDLAFDLGVFPTAIDELLAEAGV